MTTKNCPTVSQFLIRKTKLLLQFFNKEWQTKQKHQYATTFLVGRCFDDVTTVAEKQQQIPGCLIQVTWAGTSIGSVKTYTLTFHRSQTRDDGTALHYCRHEELNRWRRRGICLCAHPLKTDQNSGSGRHWNPSLPAFLSICFPYFKTLTQGKVEQVGWT